MRGVFIQFACVFLLFSGVLKAASCNVSDPRLKALYIIPEYPDHPFWGMQVNFAQTVANSLNIDLTFLHLDQRQSISFSFIDKVASEVKRNGRPDIVLGVFYLNGEKAFLNYVEKENLPFISINSSLSTMVRKQIGNPREKYKNWIAHISPNDRLGGYHLAEHLQQGEKSKPVMMAILGQTHALTSAIREKGLMQAQSKYQFELLPPIYTDWGEKQAKDATTRVLKRFKDINMIWTVGSGSALGVVEYLKINKAYKSKIRLGTFDWSLDIIPYIKKGYIQIAYGGHYKEAGWALILGVDYLAGIDFKSDTGVDIETPLKALTKDNVEEVESEIKQSWPDTDFKQFLKCRHSNIKKYPFLTFE